MLKRLNDYAGAVTAILIFVGMVISALIYFLNLRSDINYLKFQNDSLLARVDNLYLILGQQKNSIKESIDSSTLNPKLKEEALMNFNTFSSEAKSKLEAKDYDH